MKNILFISLVACLLLSCRKSISEPLLVSDGQEKPGIDSVFLAIQQSITKKGSFEWSTLSPTLLWTAIEKSSGIVAVGYQASGSLFRENQLHLIDVGEGEWLRAKQIILTEIIQIEQKLNPSIQLEDLMPWEENVLPGVKSDLDMRFSENLLSV